MCDNCDRLRDHSDYTAIQADLTGDLKDAAGNRNQADTKALGLLGGVTSAIGLEATVLVTAPHRLGWWGGTGLVLSALVFLAAAVAYGLAIRPNLAPSDADGDAQTGIVYAAGQQSTTLLEGYQIRSRDPRLRALAHTAAYHHQSRRVVRKYQLVARGIDLSLAGLVLALVAAGLAAIAALI